MSNINKELAVRIAKKLNATIDTKACKAHDIAYIFEDGILIAQFGIRRGSSKELGHDHIPRDLHISSGNARLIGQCPMSREDWIRIMHERGIIQDRRT